MPFISKRHLLAFCVLSIVKAGALTETAEAVPATPALAFGSLVQGRLDVNEKKKRELQRQAEKFTGEKS